MADNPENMVLRTLYLPLETDRQLRALAFTRDISKGELMRDLIKQGLVAIAASGERSLAEQISARLIQAQPDVAKAGAGVRAKSAGAIIEKVAKVVRTHRAPARQANPAVTKAAAVRPHKGPAGSGRASGKRHLVPAD